METVVIRRSALDSLANAFNEEFNLVEEYDLFVRIACDWKIDYVPEVLAKWRVHSNSWTWRFSENFVDESMIMLAKLKHDPALASRYSAALATAHSILITRLAIREWKSNKASCARSLIRLNTSCITIKTILVYLVTFFSYNLIHAFYRLFRPTVTPT